MENIFKNHAVTRWLVLTSFIFAWMINISTVPLMSLLIGNSHNFSFLNEHGKTHLVFSHYTHDINDHDHDHHETEFENDKQIISDENKSHSKVNHSDNVFINITSDNKIHPDHILHISTLDNQLISANNIPFNISERGPPLVISFTNIFNFTPTQDNSFLKDYYYLSGLNNLSLFLKTIILLI